MRSADQRQSLLGVLTRYASDPLFEEGSSLSVSSRTIDGDTLLHRDVLQEDCIGAEILLVNGADVNAGGDMGNTPLHYAIQTNNRHLVELMMKFGADINIRNEFGMSALDWAKDCGHDEIMRGLG